MANVQGRTTTVEQFLSATRIFEIAPGLTVDERLAIVRDIATRLQEGDHDEFFRTAVREEVVAHLKQAGVSRAGRLFDAAISTAQTSARGSSAAVIPPEPEPWPEEVDGSELLLAIAAFIDRHLVLPSGASIVLATWAVATWCVEHVFIAPILAFLSPTRQSGKTLALSLLRRLVKRPLPLTDVTTAGTFRIMDEYQPTLLWDEAECLGRGNNSQQVGVLNAGYQRGTPVFRCVGNDHDLVPFEPFGFRAVGAIGSLASTLLDRSIVIPMQRAPKRRQGDVIVMTDQNGEPKEVFNELEGDSATLELRRKIAWWARDNGRDVGRKVSAQSEMQSWLGFRGSRNWSLLFEIGRASGDETLRRLLETSRSLSGMKEVTGDDEREMLVHDIAEVFENTGAEEFSSIELARLLSADKDRPWSEYSGGRALTPHKLSLLLKPFGVTPKQFRSARKGKIRGYTREQFSMLFDGFGIEIEDAA